MPNQPLETQQKPLEVQQKKELPAKGEKTVPARYYVPSTDIFETDDALILVMEVPGVDRKNVEVRLENDELRIEARIDFGNYDGMEPLYTEYNVGHFARTFTLPQVLDQSSIGASLNDGVLSLTLKKVQKAQPRKIEIN